MIGPSKLSLAHLPTPLWSNAALNELMGLEVWVKRDDITSGAAAGNKIRKLEYLLADALERGCRHIVTCGGVQSNHARATALCARQLGMRVTLFLRSKEQGADALAGNLLLDRLASAEIRWVTPEEYRDINAIMREFAAACPEACTVIVEGGSDGLGAFGYVNAVRELAGQLARGEAGRNTHFQAIVHACGSGGTAAGVALGNALTPVAERIMAVPVCDDAAYFEEKLQRICSEARSLCSELPAPWPVEFPEGFQGPAYAVASKQQLRFMVEVASCSGLVLDPVYSGKALFALQQLADKPARALFIHTGGLPGLLAQAAELSELLSGE